MNMTLSELFTSAGARILLSAFYFNPEKMMSTETKWYGSFNFSTSTLRGYTTYLIRLYPFIFLDYVWANADTFSLFKYVPRGTIIK
jgi:hypothetical protein